VPYGLDDESRDQKSIFVQLVFGHRFHVGDVCRRLCHSCSLDRRRCGGVLSRRRYRGGIRRRRDCNSSGLRSSRDQSGGVLDRFSRGLIHNNIRRGKMYFIGRSFHTGQPRLTIGDCRMLRDTFRVR